MYLGGVIVFGTTLGVTIVVLIAAALFWRAGYFRNVEDAKYHMLRDGDRRDGDRRDDDV